MKPAGSFLLLALLQDPAILQQPGFVRGTVVDSVTGLPLVGATVLMTGSGGPFAEEPVTGGTFAFSNVPPGQYTIRVDRPGYIPNPYGAWPNDEFTAPTRVIAPGQTLSGLHIALAPEGIIHGRLTNDRGEAVVDATVEAQKTTYKDGRRERTRLQSTTTNDLGAYRLFMLPPGEYHIVVRSSRGSAATWDSVPVYFPGTIDPTEAQTITLSAGNILGEFNFLRFPRSRRIAGSVRGDTLDGVEVFLSPLNGTTSTPQTVNPDAGTFEFNNVAPGSYMLVATGGLDMRAATLIDVRNADALNASLTLGPGYRIPVRVRIEGHNDGNDPDFEKLYFLVHRDPPIPAFETDTYTPFANGTFALDVLAGSYRMDIARTEDFYVKSMTLDQVDILNGGLRVTGSSDKSMEILIGANPGAVEGRTERKGVTVVLVPDAVRRGQRVLYKSIKPDPSGRFRFEEVPPGDYKLFAWQEENGGAWLDPEYLRKHEEHGTPIRVEAGKTTRQDSLIP